ncbi:hypothetical protein ACFVHI_03580 [Kitasatospora sp. NPDC127121]|uniref:hypothetical protein n=1 Tax=unclassified Kitasatospora TaxID=2633591 RepID=UPI00362A3AAD
MPDNEFLRRFRPTSSRERNRIPEQRAADPAEDGSTDSATLPAQKFDTRVRVSLSVESAESEYIAAALREAGWNLTRDTRTHSPHTAEGRQGLDSHWLVDVPLVGISRGAERVATLEVVNLLEPHGLLFDIRGAWVLQPSAVRSAVYHVHRRLPRREGLRGRVDRIRIAMGLRDTGEVIHAASHREAAEEFSRRRHLPNPPARPARSGLRLPFPVPADRSPENGKRYWIRQDRIALYLPLGVWIGGTSIVIASEPRWTPATEHLAGLSAFALVYTLLLYLSFPHLDRPVPAAAKSAVATVFAAIGIAIGISLGENQIVTPLSRFAPLYLVFVVFGLRHLIRGTGPERLVLWAVPIAISLAPPLLRMVGDLSYGSYLKKFGMKMADVNLSTMDQVTPTTRPLAIGIASVLLILAGVGYFRQLHVDLGKLIVVPLVLLYGLVVIVSATENGSRSADGARPQVSAGKPPSAFHALTARAVCVRPTSAAAAVQGEPLVTGRPLLTFDPLAPRVALFDPATNGVTRVQASTAVLVTVADLRSPCP